MGVDPKHLRTVLLALKDDDHTHNIEKRTVYHELLIKELVKFAKRPAFSAKEPRMSTLEFKIFYSWQSDLPNVCNCHRPLQIRPPVATSK